MSRLSIPQSHPSLAGPLELGVGGQTIGGSVVNCGHMDQLDIEEEDTSYPLVDSCIGLDVWVV
jgi:hypothetical protein